MEAYRRGLSIYREILFRDLVRLPSTTYATHGLYMYPAKFIPHVVRYASERFSGPGDWVFDPFAGYGSVAMTPPRPEGRGFRPLGLGGLGYTPSGRV
jgi:hypothetical protein